MKETDLNRAVNHFFKSKKFSHKISDPVGGMGSQNPFDGFSVFDNLPWYWESKMLSHGYTSFSLKKIEEHQHENLCSVYNELKHINPNVCQIILGLFESRKFFHVMFFSYDSILYALSLNKKSFLKKDLLQLYEHNKFLSVVRENNKYIISEKSISYQEAIITKDFLVEKNVLT